MRLFRVFLEHPSYNIAWACLRNVDCAAYTRTDKVSILGIEL